MKFYALLIHVIHKLCCVGMIMRTLFPKGLTNFIIALMNFMFILNCYLKIDLESVFLQAQFIEVLSSIIILLIIVFVFIS